MVEELQPERNHLNRLFKRFSQESKAVSIATIAMVIAVLSLLMAWMAVYDAIHAKTQVEVMLESNADLKKEVRILQLKIDLYDANLRSDEGAH